MTVRTTFLTAALAVSVLSACMNDPPATDATARQEAARSRGGAIEAGRPAPPGQAALMHRPQPMRAVAEAIRARQHQAPSRRAARGGAARAQGAAAGSQ